MRIVILGNAGSGKSRMARGLCSEHGLACLPLDEIAFESGAQRRPLEASLADLRAFIARRQAWVIEGCYADLVEAALPHCTELRFLNPGMETCRQHCRERPWEPNKFPTPEAQDQGLADLLAWVATYETRDDEYGFNRHRAVFDGFAGPKREYRFASEYA